MDQTNPELRGGFSFCGVDIAELGLEYAPEIENTYVYRPAKGNVHEEVFDGHTGGYVYGASQEPKEFILRCIFEETRIDNGFLTQIQHFFKVGKSGKLVFKRRPWCYYYATVTEYNDSEITNYLNGVITITMKAYYPFARCDLIYHFRDMKNHDNVMANSALYDTDGMAPPTVYENITAKKTIILGNPGTDRAGLGISIAGDVGLGVIIENKTTKQALKFVAVSKAVTTNVGKVVKVDSISGKTMLVNEDGTDPKVLFMYHDFGFLELEPGYPSYRNIYVSYAGGTHLTTANILTKDYTGLYVYVEDEWRKIIDQPDKHTFVVDKPVLNSNQCRTTVMLLNEIEIRPVSTMDISKLSFSFKPTFA